MPCFHPLKGYAANPDLNEGKRGFVRNRNQAYTDRLMTLPCGHCHGCRVDRTSEWAIRCMHEAQMHSDNCFLTLTYSPENLPAPPSVKKKEVQDFLLRLRTHLGHSIRYYACGEYGEKLTRPHYHMLAFGYDPPDKRFHKRSGSGAPIFVSDAMDKVWGLGHVWVGTVTQASAGYVARYVMKKITGDAAEQHYRWYDDEGRRYDLEPEFNMMSKGRGNTGGIGESWWRKYGMTDCHNQDFIVGMDGKERPVPRFYDKLLERENPAMMREIKTARRKRAELFAEHNTSRRHHDRELVLKSKTQRLKREYEQ